MLILAQERQPPTQSVRLPNSGSPAETKETSTGSLAGSDHLSLLEQLILRLHSCLTITSTNGTTEPHRVRQEYLSRRFNKQRMAIKGSMGKSVSQHIECYIPTSSNVSSCAVNNGDTQVPSQDTTGSSEPSQDWG
jgi:hypothetical protein